MRLKMNLQKGIVYKYRLLFNLLLYINKCFQLIIRMFVSTLEVLWWESLYFWSIFHSLH